MAGLWLLADAAPAQTPPPNTPTPVASKVQVRKIHGVDADNRLIVVNKPGDISVVLCTNEDSQDQARLAGFALYPFRGRPDFQLAVVVDLRDSIATWVPALVLSKMRTNLDNEAVNLKPWYLKNGNRSNPRLSTYVIPDFGGTICPQLGWPETSENLRGILYGVDGRELKRWDKIEDMKAFYADVRAAIKVQVDAEQAMLARQHTGVQKFTLTPSLHPPIIPDPPPLPSDN